MSLLCSYILLPIPNVRGDKRQEISLLLVQEHRPAASAQPFDCRVHILHCPRTVVILKLSKTRIGPRIPVDETIRNNPFFALIGIRNCSV
jgi:hypothetical protein